MRTTYVFLRNLLKTAKTMKRFILLTAFFIYLLNFTTLAQSLQSENEYDFWVGEWNATWKNADGTEVHGSNMIEKTLDGKVLQEHFNDPNTGFKGTSISVYNPRNKSWHQAWADNQGGYFNFIGETDGEKRIFKTLPVEKNGKTIILRMVFYNITDTSMTWDWESSNDGGKTWNLNWQIEYTRK